MPNLSVLSTAGDCDCCCSGGDCGNDVEDEEGIVCGETDCCC